MIPRTVVNVRAFGLGRSRWIHPTNTTAYGGGYRIEIFDMDGPACLVLFREVRL